MGSRQVGRCCHEVSPWLPCSGLSHLALQQNERDLPSPILPCLRDRGSPCSKGTGKQGALLSHSGTCPVGNPDSSSRPSSAQLSHCRESSDAPAEGGTHRG